MTIVWRKLTLSSMIPHMYRWQLHLLSRLGFIFIPHYFRVKRYAKVALRWIYIRIVVGLKKKLGGMFCTLQAMQGRWMPLEDVGSHKNFKIAREAFLIYHKLYPVRAICIFGLVVLPFFEVLEEILALNSGWKMQRYMSVEGPLNCKRNGLFD
jgi:hypothetical protein